MNLILYGYSFPFTYGSLGQTPALPRPPLDPTKCKSVIPCAFTRSLNVSLFFQMDNFLQGLPTLNLTKWITDEPFLKRIPEPAFPTQERKYPDIPLLNKYGNKAPEEFWKAFPVNRDPPEDGNLTSLNIKVSF